MLGVESNVLEIERIPVGDSLEVKYNQLQKDYDKISE
jgi:hypothetical protein